MDLATFLERSNRASSTTALFQEMLSAAAAYGFHFVAYGTLTYKPEAEVTTQPPAVLLNYPAEWQARYFHRQYHLSDPVVTVTPVAARPFSWHELLAGTMLSPLQRRIFDEARAYGLNAGFSVPLHGPQGRVAVMSFASRRSDIDTRSPLGHFNMLTAQFHLAYLALTGSPLNRPADCILSSRERDCLGWSAQGKSSWDIGVILGISPNTVSFHLKNAMRKLQAGSRTVAVVKAIKLGLIDTPPPS